ncbi:putative membrane protein [Brevibacillus laterosporus GI-9]|nr:putative membrane protein [Brevibacillus laterosporus GI-9]
MGNDLIFALLIFFIVSKSSPVGHYFTLRESFFCLFSV